MKRLSSLESVELREICHKMHLRMNFVLLCALQLLVLMDQIFRYIHLNLWCSYMWRLYLYCNVCEALLAKCVIQLHLSFFPFAISKTTFILYSSWKPHLTSVLILLPLPIPASWHHHWSLMWIILATNYQ